MAKKKLDLSHALTPLHGELQALVHELIALKEQDSPLFGAAVDDFISKYGQIHYQSLDELLESSQCQAAYTQKETIPLQDLLEELNL